MAEPDATPELTLLGRGPLPPQRTLECFAVADTVTRIELTSGELICKCPVTGQPDIYRVTIVYRPSGLALETKSLKLYLASFASEPDGIFAEHLADRLAGELADATGSAALSVTLEQNIRGGIITTVTAVRGEPIA